MILETDRLILRRWTEADAESLYEYAKDPAVGPIAGWSPHKNVEESLDVIKNIFTDAECYAICEKENEKVIGAIALKLNGHITDMTEREDECMLVCSTKGGDKMLPVIDKKKTGINLRRIMDERGFTVKDVQEYLGLGSVQSVYHWLNGLSIPTVDNLYALSYLFQVPVDDLICGNRSRFLTDTEQAQLRRLRVYYEKFKEIQAA